MSLSSIIMATPFDNTQRETQSQIILMPSDLETLPRTRTDVKKKYKIFSWMELVATVASLVFFTLGSMLSENPVRDMLINACLGAITMHSILNLAYPSIFANSSTSNIAFKIVLLVGLMGVGYYSISSVKTVVQAINQLKKSAPSFVLEAKFVTTMRTVGGIFGIVDALIYAVELIIITLEIKKYI